MCWSKLKLILQKSVMPISWFRSPPSALSGRVWCRASRAGEPFSESRELIRDDYEPQKCHTLRITGATESLAAWRVDAHVRSLVGRGTWRSSGVVLIRTGLETLTVVNNPWMPTVRFGATSAQYSTAGTFHMIFLFSSQHSRGIMFHPLIHNRADSLV